MKVLILLNCFFNYYFIERTLKSINASTLRTFVYDIIFLENPSKYSDKIRELGKKYNIKAHYIAPKNVAGHVFPLFIRDNQDLLAEYEFIVLSDADVVLDRGAMQECLDILIKYPAVGNCAVDINITLKKYALIKDKIVTWVAYPIIGPDYLVGPAGTQFIMFRRQHLLDYYNCAMAGKLCTHIARGVPRFTGMCDSNLIQYNRKLNKKFFRTKKFKLDHIGWEIHLKGPKYAYLNEYRRLKDHNLGHRVIRTNIDFSKYALERLS